jgi:hypothetical protein
MFHVNSNRDINSYEQNDVPDILWSDIDFVAYYKGIKANDEHFKYKRRCQNNQKNAC